MITPISVFILIAIVIYFIWSYHKQDPGDGTDNT